MKPDFRIICLANGKFAVQMKRLFFWKAIGFMKMQTGFSVERGKPAISVVAVDAGDSHYNTIMHDTMEEAQEAMRLAKSIYGIEYGQ